MNIKISDILKSTLHRIVCLPKSQLTQPKSMCVLHRICARGYEYITNRERDRENCVLPPRHCILFTHGKRIIYNVSLASSSVPHHTSQPVRLCVGGNRKYNFFSYPHQHHRRWQYIQYFIHCVYRW